MNRTLKKSVAYAERMGKLKEELAEVTLLTARQNSGLVEDRSNEAFPLSALPSRMREMVEANAAAMGVPPELGAVAALAVVSASAGKGIQVDFRNMIARPNLFFVLGAESGGGKSKAIRSIMSPLLDFQFDSAERWERDGLTRAIALRDFLEREIQNLKINSEKEYVDQRSSLEARLQEAKASVVNPFVLICEDASEEAFVEQLAASNGALFSFSADAAKPIDNLLGRISGTTDDSHYLKAFSGDPIVKSRIGRRAASLRDPCATMLWTTTPDRIEPILQNDTLTRGGFMPRCLFATVQIEDREMTQATPPAIPEDILLGWKTTVTEIVDSYRFAGKEARKTIGCEPAALALFVEFNNQTVRRLGELHEIREVARRWTEVAVKTALVLHLARHTKDAHRHPLSEEHASGAISIVQWFNRRLVKASKDAIWERTQDRLWKIWEHIHRVANADNYWRIYPGQFCRGHRGSRKICANATEVKELLCELVAMDRLQGPFNDDFPRNRSIYFEVPEHWRGKR